jgi:hypothetical protein
MKREKREIVLIDEQGFEWIRACLSAPTLNRLIKLYRVQGVYLEERAVA